jgi:hypothetical protein
LIIPLHSGVALKALHLAAAAAVAVLRTPVLWVLAMISSAKGAMDLKEAEAKVSAKAGAMAKARAKVEHLALPRQGAPPPEVATSPAQAAQAGLSEAWPAQLLAAQAAPEMMWRSVICQCWKAGTTRTVGKRPCTIEERGGALRPHPDRATTQLHCVVFFYSLFGGGVRISGDEAGSTGCWGLGGVGVGDDGLGMEAFSPAGLSAATVAVVGEQSVLVLAVVAARLCRQQRWWRSFPAVVVGEVAVGKLQETVNTCRPEAWQNVRCCFKTTSQTALVQR